MSYWNWLLPSIGLLLLFAALWLFIYFDSIRAAKNKVRTKKQLNYLIKQNYASVLIFLMLALPVLLQLVYSAGPYIPVISASDVLTFWGVVLGLASGFYIWQIQKDKDRQDEMNRCKPVFNVLSFRNENKELAGVRIDSKCLVAFDVVKVCGLDRKRSVQPFASEVFELSKEDFDNFKAETTSSKSGASWGKGTFLSFEVVASDGTNWVLNYSFSRPGKYWTLCSTLFFSKDIE